MKPRHNTRPTPRLLACAMAAALAMGAPVVLAQSTSATVRGQVAASARVTATNTATGLVRTVQSDAKGNYAVAGLPPGNYRIDVEGGGSRTVQVGVSQNLTVNIAAPTNELNTIEVVGTPQDVRTSEVATYVSTQKIEALPQNSRNFLSFADTVPGVIFDQSTNDNTTKLRSGAQNSNGVNVFIDGVGQKNYVLKGGISGQDSSRGNPFPQLAIGEYKVITSNYKAEYDQISSAAVTAVTRSGTNDLQGSFFWDYTNTLWRDPTKAEENAGSKSHTSTEQYGMSVGGPILKDRLFYFVTYEGKDITNPRTVSANPIFGGFGLPSDLYAQTGPTASPFTEGLWFGKLTWQPDGNNLVELSLKDRNEEEITGIGGQDSFQYGTSKTNDSTRGDLRWQYNADDWINDAHLTFEDESWSPHAQNTGIGFRFTGTNDDPFRGTVLNVGAGRDFQDKGQKGWSVQDDFTWLGFEGHTIKVGAKFKAVKINAFEQQPYNPQYFVNLPTNLAVGNDTFGEFVPFQVEFGALVPGAATRDITTDAKQFGLYAQDDWQVTEHLMLNLGLRWDYEKNEGWENWVTPQNIADALRAWPNIHGPNVDYNIENYISNGSNRSSPKDQWQPRLGFSYDIGADERHVVFGGVGRTYDRNLWDYLQLEQSKYSFPTYQLHFNVPGFACDPATDNRCFEWDPAYYNPANLAALVAANPNLGAEVNVINNDLKTPYSDQFSLGMRNAFTFGTQEWTLSTTYAHIVSKDGIVFSLGNRWPDGSFRNPDVPGATWGNQPFGFSIPGFGTLIKADNGIETKLNQFLVGIDKLYTTDSPWSVTVAYTYSDASENRFNAANSDEHYLFDYPNLDGQPFLTSVGVPKHRLVVSGYGDIVWNMQVSAKLTLASEYPKDSVNCFNAASFNNCFFDSFQPDVTFGYKQFDVALRKTWDTGTDLKLWMRVDAFNLFNWRSWTDYDTWRGGPGEPNPTFGNVNGTGLQQDPRFFKLSMGFDF
ncbi:TonB-dependent receptor [Lysobacter sp. KIS68-7]|uniref:TonB-dependent receptor n=1 Tax=Lysobacter sp. KIS68-7 TaxID=2904252 RepID=UPI001E51BB74|nr:TonB-dependent receptor [Lysobacter sp. KIS68-7]UHQ19158.1 TonB-dependent receptor [Lysobacter sp. KIS68-7]